MIKLQVYIADDCWSCVESRRLLAALQPVFPAIAMELLNVSAGGYPDNVFAVPTYLLNGRIISLGNPSEAQLVQKLQAILLAPCPVP